MACRAEEADQVLWGLDQVSKNKCRGGRKKKYLNECSGGRTADVAHRGRPRRVSRVLYERRVVSSSCAPGSSRLHGTSRIACSVLRAYTVLDHPHILRAPDDALSRHAKSGDLRLVAPIFTSLCPVWKMLLSIVYTVGSVNVVILARIALFACNEHEDGIIATPQRTGRSRSENGH